jgi:Ca2+-binding RTX toxin-like protein
MSVVFFNQLPIDMTNPVNWSDFFNAVASPTHSSTSWSATNAATGGVWQFTGTGFGNYQSNVPFSGTITGITYSVNGVTLFSVSGASQNVNTFLTSGSTGDWLTAVAGLYPGSETVSGTSGADHLEGFAGNDTLSGGADSDTVNLTGSAVADVADANWNGSVITGLLNNALLDIETINMDLGAGGSGGDWLRYNTSFGVTVDLSAGTATGFASVTGVENLIGGTGGDTLVGDGGANKINGNAGDDFITGGAGGDNLTGGLGGDTFVYAAGAGADTVVDFDAWDVGGQDFIDVTAFGIDAGNFASRVTIIDTGADTVVRIDSDVFITLKNVSGDGDNVITMADFILS